MADQEQVPPLPAPAPQEAAPRYIVGVGASAGGLEALERLFSNAPTNTGMAYVVIQHLSPDFKSLMNDLLARWTSMPIHRVENGMRIEQDAVYLIPPKKDMIVSNGALLLTDRDPTQVPSLPIDRFFRSLANDMGDRAIGVVLSGSGSDGAQGVRDIREAGGLVIVQSAESAKFDGMPRSAIQAGVADLVLPPEEMPAALVRYINRSPKADFLARELDGPPDRGWDALFRLLRERHSVDFSHYRSGTIVRRTERRMMLAGVADLDAYVRRLQEDPEEANNLYRDLLIGVTRFFRDPEAFERLGEEVVPALINRAPGEGDIRVWVAGCATGEEAYSLAILFHEQLAAARSPASAKIFATDLHKASLDVASNGLYPESALSELSPQRVGRFFQRRGDFFQVSPELRQMVVFAQHNVVKDAPFTKMDLITCRNVLIYFQPLAQKKVLSLFHFALKTGRYLFLGPSEGAGELGDEFEAVDHRWKIYSKRRNVRIAPDFRLPSAAGLQVSRPLAQGGLTTEQHLLGAYDALLEKFIPAGLLVNERRELVQAFGGAGDYLRVPDGRHTGDVLDFVEGDLRVALSGALQRAARDAKPAAFKGARARVGGQEAVVNITVHPVASRRGGAAYQFVLFEEVGGPAPPPPTPPPAVDVRQASHEQLHNLETELRYTRENLQATIEELETSNEELQATNEELVASNEELQSTNEELHSVNEELYTVNAEYQRKIAELTELTTDMEHLLATTQVHTLFLDQQLCIRKFTPRMQAVFNLLPQDVGRRIDTFTHIIDHPALLEEMRQVLADGQPLERQVRDRLGHWYLLRLLPYRVNTQVEGLVLTLIDIDTLKHAQEEARRKDKLLHYVLDNTPNVAFLKDRQGRYVLGNEAFRRVYGPDALGKTAFEVLPRETAEVVTRHDQRVLATGKTEQQEVVFPHLSGGNHFLYVKFVVRDEAGAVTGLGCVGTDVTELKQAEASAKESVAQRDRFLAMLSHELRNPLSAVMSAARLIRRTSDGPRPSGEWLSVIERRSAHMSRLLDDLLDVARLAQNKIDVRYQRVDLRPLLAEVHEEVRALFEERGVRLSFTVGLDGPLMVDGDPDRLIQAQVNLLVNAAKFTPKGGEASLRLEREGNSAVIRVRDNGVGIAPEMLGRVFELFVQASAPAGGHGGIGVGLTLVKTIVQLHRGEITAYSEGQGRGTEFVVRLPLAVTAAAAPAGGPRPGAPPAGPGRKVLVVDDDPDNCMLIRDMLLLDGHQVETAGDGPEALRKFAEFRPEVAVLDIGLPGMTGYELARQAREAPGGGGVLLVALTGFGRPEDQQAALTAGFDAHLVKPLKVSALAELLARGPRSGQG